MAVRNRRHQRLRGLRNFFSLFAQQKIGIAGVIIIAILLFLSLAQPLYLHRDPNAVVHAPLSAPAWMKYFDPNYFPDTIHMDAKFSSQAEYNSLLSKIEIVAIKGSNFEVSYGWTGEDGSPASGKGCFYIEIVDDPSKPLDQYRPYVEVLIGFRVKWPYNLPPNRFQIEFFVRGEPLYGPEDLFDDLFAPGYKANELNVFLNLYDETLRRELTRIELLEYFHSRGILGLDASVYDEGYSPFGGPSTIFTTWNKRTPFPRADAIRAFFQKGNTIILKIAVKFTITDAKYRTQKVAVRYYIDDIFVKSYSYYYGLMGTDNNGRDLFAMIMDGIKISLLVGILATLGSIFIGGAVGIISGYFGGKIDEILMRIVDFLMVMPGLPLLIVLAFVFKSMGVPTFWTIIFVLTIFGWAGMARVIRSQVLSVKSAIYVEAAKAVGASDLWIMRKHIFSSVIPLIMMYLMTGVVGAILAEAGLTFLGVLTPDWNSIGKILNEASVGSIQTGGGGGGEVNPGAFGGIAWWWVFFPGLILMLVGVAFYMISEALVRIYSPRLRGY